MTVACERRATLVATALLATLALTGSAAAQSPNARAAEDAFKQGRDLFKADKFVEACEQFEKSQQLDPANGTLFNLAQCSERIGKLATAAAAYRELVAKDTNEQRKATSADRLKEIGPRVPKLFVQVDSPPPGLVVELESKAGARGIAANTPTEVDLGEYSVLARARGYTEVISRVKISEEGKTTTVEATLQPRPGRSADTPRPAGSRRKLFGITAIATGGAAIIGGVVLGSLAQSAWNDAKDVCGGTTCTSQADVDRANELGDQARSKATLSTVLTLSGVAIAGAGVLLYVTAPGGTTITPTASDRSAGVSLSGTF